MLFEPIFLTLYTLKPPWYFCDINGYGECCVCCLIESVCARQPVVFPSTLLVTDPNLDHHSGVATGESVKSKRRRSF